MSATPRKPKAATHWSARPLAKGARALGSHPTSHLAEVQATAASGGEFQVFSVVRGFRVIFFILSFSGSDMSGYFAVTLRAAGAAPKFD